MYGEEEKAGNEVIMAHFKVLSMHSLGALRKTTEA
jgi:hypothetical protein